ncbi:MAG: NUDIX hydrolase [Streptosporangiaceae bacterium]
MSERRVPSRVPVPRGMAERARDFFARGLAPAVPRDAATVILLRQGPGVEVYLLRRAGALEFAPGACVFPGGSVDAPDADPGVGEAGWAGPSPADLGGLLGTPADRARALVCAAVRETFEESGVLLAGPSPAELVGDAAALEQDRSSLLTGSASLGDLLRLRGLLLRADLLTPWARWITPVISPRRFDTWFFAAILPPGQTASLAASESDSGSWWEPSAALDAARSGEITLLPPTAVTLAELAAYQDVAAVMAARRQIVPLLPTAVVEDDQVWLAMPAEVEYPL